MRDWCGDVVALSPRLAIGEKLDGYPIEWVGSAKALVYYGAGSFRNRADRPVVGTSGDVLAVSSGISLRN